MAQIELIHALAERQWRVFLEYEPGMTLAQAWQTSGLEQKFPLQKKRFAVSGIIVDDPYKHRLEKGDRVHSIRPLLADPKEARRIRAAAQAHTDKG